MRAIKTLQDAEIVIRDLHNQLDKFRSENIDMSKRRVVNAHPSRDDYDYVVRKELQEATTQVVTQQQSTNTPKRYSIVFSSNPVVLPGQPATPPYIIKFPGRPIQVSVLTLQPTFDQGFVFSVGLMGVSIKADYGNWELPLTAPVGIPLNFTDIRSDVSFQVDQYICINVFSTSGIRKVTIQIVVEE